MILPIRSKMILNPNFTITLCYKENVLTFLSLYCNVIFRLEQKSFDINNNEINNILTVKYPIIKCSSHKDVILYFYS